MNNPVSKIGCLCRVLVSLATFFPALFIQAQGGVPNELNTGYPENSNFHGTEIEQVQLQNGNLHMHIPVYADNGRGLGTGYGFYYDNHGWSLRRQCFTVADFCRDTVSKDALSNTTLTGRGSQDYAIAAAGGGAVYCYNSFGAEIFAWTIGGFFVREPDGTKHHFSPDPVRLNGSPGSCAGVVQSTVYADDGSGWTMQLDLNSGNILYATNKNGTRVYNSGTIVGANGNQIVWNPSTYLWTDTLGRTIPANGSYYDSSGTLRSVSVTRDTYNHPTQITLPDSQSTYLISYAPIAPTQLCQFSDADECWESSDADEISSITLPTGGQVSYTFGPWDEGGRPVASRTVSANGVVGTWSYTPGTSAMTITDAAGKDMVITGVSPTGCYPSEIKKYYDGPAATSPLIKTIQTDYDCQSAVINGSVHSPSSPISIPIRVTTTWNQENLVSKVETDWDIASLPIGTFTWKNPIERREYDWGTGVVGPLMRRTHYSYRHLEADGLSYRNANIANLPTLVQTYDGAGNLVEQTQNYYDTSSLVSTGSCGGGGSPGHDYCSFGADNLLRGNLTQTAHWLNTNNTWLPTTYTYDDLGNQLSITDALNRVTTVSYDDNWADSSCSISANTRAFPTLVTNPLLQRSKSSYYPCTGFVRSTQDENDLRAGRAGTTHSYDLLNRPLCTNATDGGQTCFSYNDSLPMTITKTVTATPNPDIVSAVQLDQLGRTAQTHQFDPEGDVYAEVTYDALGRKSTETNPHRAVPAATDGTTQYTYDRFGRVTDITRQDGNGVHTVYSANMITTTDESDRQRRTLSDASGRLIEVDEPGGGSPGSVATGGLSISGTLQSKSATGAVPGTGSVTVSGSEQSKAGSPGTPGSVSITISGYEASTQVDPCYNPDIEPPIGQDPPSCPRTVYDAGTVTVTVNGQSDSGGYGSTSDSNTVASGVASTINGDSAASVTASVSGSVLTLTSKTTGAATNYAFSTSAWTVDPADFGGPSFGAYPVSGSLTGGTNSGPQVYDHGTCTVTINGTVYSKSYGQGDTASSIASGLASVITAGSWATATASGSTIFITAKTGGAATNYPLLSSTSCSYDSSNFSSVSFSTSTSGSTLTGGMDGSPAAIDAGTVQLSVGGYTATANYGNGTGQDSTATAVASDLTGKIRGQLPGSNPPFTISSSGTAINVVWGSVGTSGNVTMTTSSTTTQSAYFSKPSFAACTIDTNPQNCSTTLAGGANPVPDSLSTPYVTLYSYNTLGGLLRVDQKGSAPNDPSKWRTRLFTYDSLSRLLTAYNPESGQTTYQYDAVGNLVSKTDARGITVNYSPSDSPIDALNRVTKKTYSNGDPSVTYVYDQGTEGIGHLYSASTGSASSTFTYDPVGRIVLETNCLPSGCTGNAVTAAYDLAGALTSLTYPDGRKIVSAYSAAGRITGITLDSFNGTPVGLNYYSVPQSTLATAWGYWPTGASNRDNFANGVSETTSFNNRLQITSIVDVKGATNLFNKSYVFYDGSGHNNGKILGINDGISSSRNQTFTYDAMNRLTTGMQADNAFNIAYAYDPWGNMRESGTSNFQPIYDINNRIQQPANCSPVAQYCYDAAGDLLKDNNNHTFTYDGEARIRTVDGTVATYTYGPDGQRVRKDVTGAGTEYIYFTGNIIAEKNPGTGAWTDYIFAGKRIAKDTSNNGSGAQYYHSDHLGSARIMTDSAGTVISDCTFNPFGEQVICSPDNASNHYRFTGKERDSEDGLDDFGARYFSSSMGRWMTPDWSARPATVPYANFGDPQSLNLYLYVRNDPVSEADSDGHVSGNGGPGKPGNCYLDGAAIDCGWLDGLTSEDDHRGNWYVTNASQANGGGEDDEQQGDSSNTSQQPPPANPNQIVVGQRPLLAGGGADHWYHTYLMIPVFVDGKWVYAVYGVLGVEGCHGARKCDQQVRGPEDQNGRNGPKAGSNRNSFYVVTVTKEQREALLAGARYWSQPGHECPSCGKHYDLGGPQNAHSGYNSNTWVYNMLIHNPAGRIEPPVTDRLNRTTTPGYQVNDVGHEYYPK